MVDGHIEIRNRLGLYALSGIDYQEGTFASGNRAAYFVREVNVSRGINQV